MDLQEFVEQFPDFQLVELLLQGGRDVMWGLGYSRRNKRQQAESAQQEAIGGLKI